MKANKKNSTFSMAFSLSLTSILLFCSLFHKPSLKGIIKQGRLKPLPFLTMARMQAKIFLYFCNSLLSPFYLTYPVLFSVFHALYSKSIGKQLNSLLLALLTKSSGVFSTYTPEIISLVTIILKNRKYKNISTKSIVKNYQFYITQNHRGKNVRQAVLTWTLPLFIYIYIYNHRKWNQQLEFKSWLKLLAFCFALRPLRKACTHLFQTSFSSAMSKLLRRLNS